MSVVDGPKWFERSSVEVPCLFWMSSGSRGGDVRLSGIIFLLWRCPARFECDLHFPEGTCPHWRWPAFPVGYAYFSNLVCVQWRWPALFVRQLFSPQVAGCCLRTPAFVFVVISSHWDVVGPFCFHSGLLGFGARRLILSGINLGCIQWLRSVLQ